jgi:hypothetical protein
VQGVAKSTVVSLGKVVTVGALVTGTRDQKGNLNVSGTVKTRHNGPFSLQAQLSHPYNDTVYAKTPTGPMLILSTTSWVTVSNGPGGPGYTNSVAYYIAWGKNSPKNPQTATNIPVSYRVIPR